MVLCDRFRDQDLVNLGVQLDDGQGAGELSQIYTRGHFKLTRFLDGGALYKLVDPEVLIRAREEKAAIAADKAAKKAANVAAAEAKRIATLEKGKTPHMEMFKPPNVADGLYSQWDDQGLPTHDKEGKEVTKSARKKMEKESKAQEKAHQAYLAWKEESKA